MLPWLKKPTTQAGLLVVAGFGLTVAIAVLGGTADAAVLLLLTLLAGVLQYAGAAKFHATGRADPSLARASVRRLIALATRARDAKTLAERAYEDGTPADARKALGRLSAEMSYLEEGAVLAIEDWREFHRDALADLKEDESNG